MFSFEQEQIFLGGLLGDSNLEKNKNTRFKIERSYKDFNYLNFQFDIFKDYCKKINTYERYDKRYNKTYKSCYIKSSTLPFLNYYYDKWYVNKIKVIPKDLKITPLMLAVWFADDGCITEYKGNGFTVKFSTESFSTEEVDYLIDQLQYMFNVKFYKYSKKKDSNQFIIKSGSEPARLVMNCIKDNLNKFGMDRKIKYINKSKYYKKNIVSIVP